MQIDKPRQQVRAQKQTEQKNSFLETSLLKLNYQSLNASRSEVCSKEKQSTEVSNSPPWNGDSIQQESAATFANIDKYSIRCKLRVLVFRKSDHTIALEIWNVL